MTAKKLTAEQEDDVLAQAAQIQEARAAAAKADVEARFAPLLELRDSAAFAEVRTKLQELAPQFLDASTVYQNLTTMGRVMDALDMVIPLDARPLPEPVPAEPAS